MRVWIDRWNVAAIWTMALPLALSGCSSTQGGSDGGDGGLPACGNQTPEALAACVEQARYQQDLATISGARPPGSAHWQEVQDLCADRFTQLGYQVERQDYGTGTNVLGVLPGSSKAAERVLLSAHYDSVSDCAGADDNGSGVAGLFEAARVLATADHARTLVVACWDEEERGLIGSAAFVARAQQDNQQILGSLVFEMIGYQNGAANSQTVPTGFDLLFPDQYAKLEAEEFKADFIALIHDPASAEQAQAFARYATRVGLRAEAVPVPENLKNSDLLSDLRRSDHAPFWQADLPAIQITDTSEFRYGGYHCADFADEAARLDPAFATRVVQATVGAAAETLTGI